MSLVLRQLLETDELAFFEGLSEWSDKERRYYTFDWEPGVSYSQLLDTLARRKSGIDLAPGKVPSTMYYGFVDGTIVGRVNARHRLNDSLRRRGGHIGYAVAPRFRRNGYGSEMFRQVLPICSELGLKELLITCKDENVASWKIIEKFAGKLEDKVWNEKHRELVRRYWINL